MASNPFPFHLLSRDLQLEVRLKCPGLTRRLLALTCRYEQANRIVPSSYWEPPHPPPPPHTLDVPYWFHCCIEFDLAEAASMQMINSYYAIASHLDEGTSFRRLATAAAYFGRFEVLLWLESNPIAPHEWNVCAFAYVSGHYDIVNWQLDKPLSRHDATEHRLVNLAASSGDIPLLRKLFVERQRWLARNEYACAAAAWKGQLSTIEFLESLSFPTKLVMEYLIPRGIIEELDWAFNKGYKFTSRCGIVAAEQDLTVLQWMIDHGYHQFDSSALSRAISLEKQQHCELMVKFGCSVGPTALHAAISTNSFSMILWTLSNGAKWRQYESALAAANVNIELLEWVLQKGYPCDIRQLKYSENEVISEWARKKLD